MENRLTFDIAADEVEIFLEEVDGLLQAMERGILRLERAADAEALNSLFRAAHTLKGVAGMVGHFPMAGLSHVMESLFDAMREGELTLTQAAADALLSAIDALRALRDEVASRQPSGIDVVPLLARLRRLDKGDDRGGEPPAASASAPGRLTAEQAAQAEARRKGGLALLEIKAAVSAEVSAPVGRLMQAVMALAEAGQIIAQQPSQDDLIGGGRPARRLWAVLATQSEGEVVEALLADVSGLVECSVRPFEF